MACSASAKVFAATIDGHHTDFAVHCYSDRVFVSISQRGRVGNLYLVTSDVAATPFPTTAPTTVYTVRSVLGHDAPPLTVAARALAAQLCLRRPLLLSLTLLAPPPAASLAAIAELLRPALQC